MDGDLSNGDVAQPSPVDIGREFIRQYYTMLSEHPSDAHRFYSHESTFIHNEVNVTGQQKIQKAIEEIGFNESKVRVFSIKGSSTISGGIVLQVAGEMTIKGANTRRFTQTFVLGQQTAKKFYVHNDVFVFCDKVFLDSETSSPAPPVPNQKSQLNGIPENKPLVNGHSEHKSNSPIKEEKKETDFDREPVVQKKETTPKKIEVEKKASPLAPEPTKPVPTPVDSTPKTWARLVGGGNVTPKAAEQRSVQAQPLTPHKPVEKKEIPVRDVRHEQSSTSDRKIYLGNIARNALPEHTNLAEQEIKQFFSRFGEVEHVGMPRRVLENPTENRSAFAFITMKTSADAANVFKAARKDDSRNQHYIHVKIDAFGFDGEATISEQKGDRPSNGIGGGRGGNYGGARGGNNQGGFVSRGGRGRGGFRGASQQH